MTLAETSSQSRPRVLPQRQVAFDQEVPALGFLEIESISRGLVLTDIVLKKAPVQIIFSEPVSSGKHLLLFQGDVACVDESYHAALETPDSHLVRQIFIPQVHPQLAPFLSLQPHLRKEIPAEEEPAIGILESKTLAGAILATDRVLKMADTTLSRLRLGSGIGGKAYSVFWGSLEEIQAAMEAGQEVLEDLESLVRTDIIPRPIGEAFDYF